MKNITSYKDTLRTVVYTLLEHDPELIKVTHFINPKNKVPVVVRATRKRYGGKFLNIGPVEISLWIGRANFIEREYLKKNKGKLSSSLLLKYYNPKPNKLKRKSK